MRVYLAAVVFAVVWNASLCNIIAPYPIDYLAYCHGDQYCTRFCPFIFSLFMTSLPQMVPCILGIGHVVNCTAEENVCDTWCTHLYAQLHQASKPVEWDSCAAGTYPDGCEKGTNCGTWCDLVGELYEFLDADIRQCLLTGEASKTCEDQTLCQNLCYNYEKGGKMAPDSVFNCAFRGYPMMHV